MKGLLIAVYSVCLAGSLIAVRADDASATETHKNSSTSSSSTTTEHKHPVLTEEQKTARKDLLAKYDANHDGKLDKEERAKVSDEDKTKLKKAGWAPKSKKSAKKQ
jgi:hypothetical protein